jgi:hypothetical protein
MSDIFGETLDQLNRGLPFDGNGNQTDDMTSISRTKYPLECTDFDWYACIFVLHQCLLKFLVFLDFTIVFIIP